MNKVNTVMYSGNGLMFNNLALRYELSVAYHFLINRLI